MLSPVHQRAFVIFSVCVFCGHMGLESRVDFFWAARSVRYRQTNPDGSHTETLLYNLKEREVMTFTLLKLRVTSDPNSRLNSNVWHVHTYLCLLYLYAVYCSLSNYSTGGAHIKSPSVLHAFNTILCDPVNLYHSKHSLASVHCQNWKQICLASTSWHIR